MRISSALALLLALAACGKAPADDRAAAKTDAAPADRGERIACAQGSAPLARSCTVDRAAGADGLVLTIRHPDGAFRRLQVTGDGRGVIAADGAEPAKVAVVGTDGIEVTVGGDRYRLPATIGAAPPAP